MDVGGRNDTNFRRGERRRTCCVTDHLGRGKKGKGRHDMKREEEVEGVKDYGNHGDEEKDSP